MIELARRYGRYGYRRIAALLRDAGWQVNDKRVERLWRREGLKVPGKQPKRGRLWLNDGSCVRLRAGRADHVWSYDFVHHRTHDGRAFRTLNVLDEFTRESLAWPSVKPVKSTSIVAAAKSTSRRASPVTSTVLNCVARTPPVHTASPLTGLVPVGVPSM